MSTDDNIELACLLEATARKVGNVHPLASFEDLTYDDFVQAASAIGPPLAQCTAHTIGKSVFNSIQATQSRPASNINLGIALLIAPLAAVPADTPLSAGLSRILAGTTVDDAEHVYAAIRLANPGGMGKVDSQDVGSRPTVTLQEAMQLAAHRDRIAEQYVTDFSYLTNFACPVFVDQWNWCLDLSGFFAAGDWLVRLPGITCWEAAIIRLQIRLLADAPDSLIARKCGVDTAVEAQQQAAHLHDLDWPMTMRSWSAFHEFDAWLRADGHRRNPGTTADLIAATIFIALRDGLIEPPSKQQVLDHAAQIRQSGVERHCPQKGD